MKKRYAYRKKFTRKAGVFLWILLFQGLCMKRRWSIDKLPSKKKRILVGFFSMPISPLLAHFETRIISYLLIYILSFLTNEERAEKLERRACPFNLPSS